MTPDEKVLSDVAAYGWHVIKVAADARGPAFAFTVGLTKTFAHPEVILFGLPLGTMHAVLNNIGALVREGRRLLPGAVFAEVLDGYDCEFIRVPTSAYRDFFGCASWFYKGDEFDAVQCVWPDRHGHFPWDANMTDEVRELQPVLGQRGA